MFELLFISYINKFLFGLKIYRHKKLAIYFILITPGIFKILTLRESLKIDKKKIFKIYKWIIPIGIIINILVLFCRDYSLCKIIWLLDYKYCSISKLLIIKSLCGFLISIIASIIASSIKCIDKNTFKDINYICTVNVTDNINKKTEFYYDNFKIYFRDIWRENRENIDNFIYIILIVLKSFLFFLIEFLSMLIIKHLNQVYLICVSSIFYLCLKILKITLQKFTKSFNVKLYDILAESFSNIGIIIYLELIELNFCKLNFDLRKNIMIRSLNETNINQEFNENGLLIDDDDDNDNGNDKEDNPAIEM